MANIFPLKALKNDNIANKLVLMSYLGNHTTPDNQMNHNQTSATQESTPRSSSNGTRGRTAGSISSGGSNDSERNHSHDIHNGNGNNPPTSFTSPSLTGPNSRIPRSGTNGYVNLSYEILTVIKLIDIM